MFGIGKEIKKFGEKVENYENKIENKLIERILKNKVINETHATGKLGMDLKKETVDVLPDIYKQMIEKKGKVAVIPIIPDEAEIWIRAIYSDKSNEKELMKYINKMLGEIADEREKIKAKIYLTKFYRKVISAAALIKDEVMTINDSLRKLDERTLEEVKRIKEDKKEEKLVGRVIDYAKKVIRYAVQVIIPSGGIRVLENISQYVKDMDFIQKAIIAFSVFALEEAIVNSYLGWKKKKKLDDLYEEYDKKEQELKEKARKTMNSVISSTIKDLEDIAKQIYGECT